MSDETVRVPAADILALADEWEALGRTFAHNSAWYESQLRALVAAAERTTADEGEAP